MADKIDSIEKKKKNSALAIFNKISIDFMLQENFLGKKSKEKF